MVREYLHREETKDIVVRFENKKEFKMKTTQSISDIRLTILEGGNKWKFNEIPINFNKNAVFLKYTIVSLRNINFGQMQYWEQKDLTSEVKNNGQFPFNFFICDFNDYTAKAVIKTEMGKKKQRKK